MSDEANIAGVIIAVIVVGALAGPELSHSTPAASRSSTSDSTNIAGSDDDGARATRGCVAGHAVGSPATISLNGSTVASVTQYYGTCDGNRRNWTTVLFTPAAIKNYSTQAWAAIAAGQDQHLGEQSAESTSNLTSSPVATTGQCTRSTATVRLVRISDRHSFGPLTASTARHC